MGRRVYGWEFNIVASLPGCYHADSGSTEQQQRKMAAPNSWMFLIHFCTVGGSGHMLSISFKTYGKNGDMKRNKCSLVKVFELVIMVRRDSLLFFHQSTGTSEHKMK